MSLTLLLLILEFFMSKRKMGEIYLGVESKGIAEKVCQKLKWCVIFLIYPAYDRIFIIFSSVILIVG